eukprot:CAMPEP_0116952542 /NCGR_PEP_ID=MMETSP0467-20121206/40806_1 /TAXON_ID=283647 /ORGANISM="Mesodinium pulex, Strain SPMC105" /LENGTH=308 /DNA_ID=CAMNT_0004637857 /DNA_START=283 /DNA_END=1210 /DNA_ORIENTATION=+
MQGMPGAGHVGHSVASDCQLVALDLLADFDQAVVEELQGARRLDAEHAGKAHGLLHAHLDRVHADQPDHVLGARRQGVRADLEGLVPVVGVLPEADFVLLQEHGVVEVDVAQRSGEVALLGLELEVVDPFVAVADLEQQRETQGRVDALVDFGLGVFGDQGLLRHEGVDELELGQLVVAVDGVLGGGLDLDAGQDLLERLVLLLGQVLVEVGGRSLVAADQSQEQFGGVLVVLVHVPLAALAGDHAFVVETQGGAWVQIHGLHHVRVRNVDGGLEPLVAGAWPVSALVSLVERQGRLGEELFYSWRFA